MRNTPGRVTASHALPQLSEHWLKGTHGNAGKIPQAIADKLRGREFSSFDQFRQAFWKEVTNDPIASRGFDVEDLERMMKGRPPFVDPSQQLGGQRSYQLHHATPIQRGGSVYDLDNIMVVTPRYHQEILEKTFHMGTKK